jgi:hypothetical protein
MYAHIDTNGSSWWTLDMDELKMDVGWTEMHLVPKICVDDTLDIVSGKYAGRRATVVKITEKMVVV